MPPNRHPGDASNADDEHPIQKLEYSTRPTAPGLFLLIYSLVVIVSAALSVGALVLTAVRVIPGRGPWSWLGAPSCFSLPLTVAAFIQYRAVFLRQKTVAFQGAIVHWIFAGFVVFGIVSNLAEALSEHQEVPWGFAAICVVVAAAAVVIVFAGVADFRWSRVLGDEEEQVVRSHDQATR
jgi:hypothetical protein